MSTRLSHSDRNNYIKNQEKKFLHNVAQRVSNPDIFILMNRWDLTVDEPEMTESVNIINFSNF